MLRGIGRDVVCVAVSTNIKQVAKNEEENGAVTAVTEGCELLD